MATLRGLKANIVALASRPSFSSAGAWAAISGLLILVVGGLAIHAGGLLELLYPLVALMVGVLLYWRYPALYLGFTWWLWFLTPEVRRLVDYQQGWNPESPVMLAPLLVTALGFFALLRHLQELRLYRFLPFGLIFLGLLYSYGVGLYKVGPLAATFDLLNWSIPVALAFHLMLHWRSYPSDRGVIQRTFVWGVLVMGSYGLVQYFALPAWDRYWLLSAPITSTSSLNYIIPGLAIDFPEPFWIRVFSTLNSQGPFAVVMMAGLLLLFSGGGRLRWPAAAVGYASFLLSFVRAAWGSWLVGLLLILAQGRRFRLRLLVILTAIGLSVLPLLVIGSVVGEIQERFQSFANLGQDYSIQDRLKSFSEVLPQALLEPVGHGLGSTGVATKLSTPGGGLGEFGNFDSGLLNIPFVLGWLGSLLYLAGLAWLLFYALRGKGLQSDLFAITSRGIVIAVLAQLIFANTMVGVQGAVFWCFLGLSLAASACHAHNIQCSDKRDSIKRLT